jgi:hypothetical protein
MGKRRSDADCRRFFDEFLCVKIPRLRATGVVQLDAPHAIIQVGDGRKLIGLAHVRFRNAGSWSLFRCSKCARRTNRLWLIEDRPHCVNGLNIWHRTKWGVRTPRTPESQRQGPRRTDRQARNDRGAPLQSSARTTLRNGKPQAHARRTRASEESTDNYGSRNYFASQGRT